MRVVIGPVPADSAAAWLAYARQTLAELPELAPDACFTTPELLEIFAEYLDSWEAVDTRSGEFRWARDLDPERVEYHVHAFFQIAEVLAKRAADDGVRHAPPEGDEFYAAVVSGVVTGLAEAGPAAAEYAGHLLQFWPGEVVAT